MRKVLTRLGMLGLAFGAWKIASSEKRAEKTVSKTRCRAQVRTGNSVLLTVSGTIAQGIKEQIAQKKRPYADYMAMADTFGADLLDYGEARRQSSWFGGLLEKVGGPNLLMAWSCFTQRHRYEVIFTDGEQIGMPLALLTKFFGVFGGRGARHLMIVHILSVGKKMLFFDWLRIQSDIDIFFVYSTWQKRFIENRWNVPSERVVFTPFMVDADFFAPHQVTAGASELSKELLLPALETRKEAYAGIADAGTSANGETSRKQPMICSVGLEFRDYPTLMKAVKGLDVHVVVAAGSPWSKREDSTAGEEIPKNVTVRRFTQYDLRQVYGDCNFMVMPLYNVDFQAGVTAILEAMAMSKAVICSQTPGQTDVVVEGETGLYVPPGDAEALKKAIEYLLNNPQEAERMGRAGRKRIEDEMSLDCYVEGLNPYVQ